MSSQKPPMVPEDDTISQLIGIGIGVAVGLLFGILAMHVPGPDLMSFILLLWIPAVLLHELAHAVVGKSVGAYVHFIKLGLTSNPQGKHFDFRLIGFNWQIYSVPVSGAVFTYFRNPAHYRRDVFLMTAAGPAASLAAAASGIVPFLWVSDQAILTPLAGWFLINTYHFLGTAIPNKRRVRAGRLSQTDGYRIWKLFKKSDEEIKKQCAQADLHIELKTVKENMQALSVEEAIARFDAAPRRLATLVSVIEKLRIEKDPRLGQYVTALVSHPYADPVNYSQFLDVFLTEQLTDGPTGGESILDQLSEKLVAVSNRSITSLGTRGSILVDIGRVEEGRIMLEDVLAKTTSTIDQTYANIFLALAAKLQGRLDLAHQHAKAAATFDPDCPALKRIADLLESSQRRS